jgi:hypothetical protein
MAPPRTCRLLLSGLVERGESASEAPEGPFNRPELIPSRRRQSYSRSWNAFADRGFRIDQLSYACAGVGSPARARHSRSICRIIGGYTIRCRKGLIAAM